MMRLSNCIRVVIAMVLVLAATSILAGENPIRGLSGEALKARLLSLSQMTVWM